MALGFDRRRFLIGGCALFACRPAGDAPGETSGETGETSDTADSVAESDSAGESEAPLEYPCGQAESPDAGWTELPLAAYPDLATVGGWYGVTAGGRTLVVAHVEEGCYAAIQRACAHEGRAIDYSPERGQFVCPAHGAVYAADGEAVSGPQPSGLPVYPCVREGDSVWVNAG